MQKLILISFLVIPIQLLAQQPNRIKGIVVDKNEAIKKVNITNTRSGLTDITNSNGNFYIDVLIADTLYIHHPNYFSKKIIITTELLKEKYVAVELSSKNITLNEMVINTTNLDEMDLGIIQNKIPELTKTERMEYASKMNFKDVREGKLGLDPLINTLSGRRKMVKKIISKEKENQLFDRIKNTYEQHFFNELHLNEEQQNSYTMYLTGIENLEEIIFSKNKTMNLFNINQIYKNDYSLWLNQN
jgi:hypothetical protein